MLSQKWGLGLIVKQPTVLGDFRAKPLNSVPFEYDPNGCGETEGLWRSLRYTEFRKCMVE